MPLQHCLSRAAPPPPRQVLSHPSSCLALVKTRGRIHVLDCDALLLQHLMLQHNHHHDHANGHNRHRNHYNRRNHLARELNRQCWSMTARGRWAKERDTNPLGAPGDVPHHWVKDGAGQC